MDLQHDKDKAYASSEEQEKLKKIFDMSQPRLVEDKDPKPPKPTALSEVHRLKLENVSLKLMNIGQQFEKLASERVKFSRQFDELRRECMDVYGVDIATTHISEDGSFGGPIQPTMAPPIMPKASK